MFVVHIAYSVVCSIAVLTTSAKCCLSSFHTVPTSATFPRCFAVDLIWDQQWHLLPAVFLNQVRAQLAKSQMTRRSFDFTELECCFQHRRRRHRRDSLSKNSRSDESGEMKRAVESGFTNKIHLQAAKVWQLWQHKLLLCVFTSPSISNPTWALITSRHSVIHTSFTFDKVFWLWMSDAGTYKASWTYWD